jgi:hypothetical protein
LRGALDVASGLAFCEFLLKVGENHQSLRVPGLPNQYIKVDPQYLFGCKSVEKADIEQLIRWCYPSSIDSNTLQPEEQERKKPD